MIRKLISGGQTGVDRAALDVAIACGLDCGGWCPKGRRAEAGPIPPHYPLEETPSAAYPQRTEWNVRDSDGTLVLVAGEPDGGTRLTIQLAERYQKPCCVATLDSDAEIGRVRAWLDSCMIRVLNVAGPRESSHPGIYHMALSFLYKLVKPAGNEAKSE
ncbi:MAG: hypothetical protein KatS3mg105_1322 [Gemmatales bacterium]|nr:MAG: hypothetical protein KatS3mg105_1322 [Gemmatales bacterium]